MRAATMIVALFAAIIVCGRAGAQVAERERIEIGLSTDRISITSDFSGADLTIFGALDNLDPLVRRQNRYDVIVTLEGPERLTTLRRKERVFGMWINMDSRDFANAPTSYSLSSTRPLRDMATEKGLQLLSLGIGNLPIKPQADSGDPESDSEFGQALREIMVDKQLYNERIGDVQFLSTNLFRAALSLPANVPIGVHRARAYLFKNGQFITETSAQLEIRKSGVEQMIYDYAHRYSFFYGIFAVALAMLTGWLGRLIFQKD